MKKQYRMKKNSTMSYRKLVKSQMQLFNKSNQKNQSNKKKLKKHNKKLN